ncbi:MAG: hypothetical protein ACN6PO_01785 [Stenotrophomonas bentonitica]|jgi:hypothetical protein
MNQLNESDVQDALQQRLVREEAGRRATDGLMRTARTLRWIGWGCALVPIVGIFGVVLFLLSTILCFAYAQSKGNPDGIKQLLITLASLFAAGIVWVLVNLTVLGLFGAAMSMH